MKNLILAVLLIISIGSYTQEKDYNSKKGLAVNGYDLIEYFNNNAVKGSKKHSFLFDKLTYRFVSKENLNKFKKSPKSYLPQYGGYCAYAIGAKGEKVSINPKTFEIRDGKLYLFYNSWGTNTLELWQNEGAEKLREKADKNWEKIKYKN